ncbi:homeodomain-interacting protein kinase 1-like [Mugil cephalus]|uniref:homeodomain-interacting protein kinase 1-like n=1 Tax=Mugil cephalus TaxID=48193 RepID=UPI001FB7153C|nr:homeodomain-interacting protein kinase 1-like [Mugil cephalus]
MKPHENNLDECNIVKLRIQSRKNSQRPDLELLDISLLDYLIDLGQPMQLEDIRTMIQQLATAFDALKTLGITHTDVKPDNIMLVDRVRQPLRVKLIDFGLSMYPWQAKQGMRLQTPSYRAPEIILGLPFTEAIDIWSLGCVMAIMVFGVTLFPGRMEYDVIKFITDLLGPAPQHLLNAGKKLLMYFKREDCGQWQLKTPEEYWMEWGGTFDFVDNRFYKFRSLDEMKAVRRETDNATEADERNQCIELLKAMLQWDEKDRITPSCILNHPFITKSYLNSSPHLSPCNESEATTSQDQTVSKETKTMTKVEETTSETLPPGVILVRPADPKNRILLGDTLQEDTDLSSEHEATTRQEQRVSKETETMTMVEESPHPSVAPAPTVHTNSIHLETELPTIPLDDSKGQKKKKKKKNYFKRFSSWIRRTFCCCISQVMD